MKPIRTMFVIAFSVVALGALTPNESRAVEEDARVMVRTPVERFVLAFSETREDIVRVGNFHNVAFRLESREGVRTIERVQDSESVIATFDYADCSPGQESLLAAPLGKLPRGKAAWVDFIEVETLVPTQSPRWLGGVCFGYRTSDGAWHWRLASTPLVQDTGSERARARLWVKEGDVDAIKLVFDRSVPSQGLRSISVMTAAPPAMPARRE